MSVSVAQWIARWTSNPEVAGSNPAGDEFLVSHEITLFHGDEFLVSHEITLFHG